MSRFRSLVFLLSFVLFWAIQGHAEGLKLLISVEQQDIAVPNPVRATLHFHNSGQQTIWLYRPVRSMKSSNQTNNPLGLSNQPPARAAIGTVLKVQLVSLNPPPGSKSNEAEGHGFVLAPDDLPHPKLVRLEPGKDYDEKVSLHVEPAGSAEGSVSKSVWGRYSFSVTYSANYSNEEVLARDINANLWVGYVKSNIVKLDLKPSTGRGSIDGTVLDRMGRPYGGALVTLSDKNENSLNQVYTDMNGHFLFTHLPLGQYWITVRDPGSSRDTSVFRLVDVSRVNQPATAQIMMVPLEANKADRLLHKPVLFHIVDNKGKSLENVRLAILRTTGNVIQNVKTQTKEDGFTAVNLIPGLNLVTLQLHGCKKKQRQADVAHGPGVDGFKFVFDCTKK